MRFHSEHRFAWPVDAVMGAMADPELYRRLQLPGVGVPAILGRESTGSRIRLQLRYCFVGQLDPIARRVAGSQQLRWVQEIELDQSSQSGRLTFSSEDRSRRLHGQGRIGFEHERGETTRTIDGEVVVRVPLIAGKAERSIVEGLLGRLDLEAAAIRSQLAHP